MTTETPDVAYAAFTAAETFLNTLGELEERAEEGEEIADGEWPPTAGPYCGCGTCDLREGLFAAWPVFLSGVTDLLRAHGLVDAAELVADELMVEGYGRAA